MAEDTLMLEFDDEIKLEKARVGKNFYTLSEATGDAAVKYRETLLRSTKLNDDGKPSGFNGLSEIEPLLVSLCLYQGFPPPMLPDGLTPDPKALVPVTRIKRWPSRIYRGFYKRIREISDLVEEEDKEEDIAKQIGKLQKKLDTIRAVREGNSSSADHSTDGTRSENDSDSTHSISNISGRTDGTKMSSVG